MGGAQPLAATMAGATYLGADIDPKRIEKRLAIKYIDKILDCLVLIAIRIWVFHLTIY